MKKKKKKRERERSPEAEAAEKKVSPDQAAISWLGFPGGSDSKASAYNGGDAGSIPGLGRCPGEGNGNPLQYSCLENPMDWGAWWATVHGVIKSQTRLSNFTFTFVVSTCVPASLLALQIPSRSSGQMVLFSFFGEVDDDSIVI